VKHFSCRFEIEKRYNYTLGPTPRDVLVTSRRSDVSVKYEVPKAWKRMTQDWRGCKIWTTRKNYRKTHRNAER